MPQGRYSSLSNTTRTRLSIAVLLEMSRGRYSNAMLVTHGAEEFIVETYCNRLAGEP